MKFVIPIFNKRKESLSRKQYWLRNAIWWIYTIIWLIILFSIWYFWNTTFWYKLIVNFILILGTPALSDLFKSYDKYKKEWDTKYKNGDADSVGVN